MKSTFVRNFVALMLAVAVAWASPPASAASDSFQQIKLSASMIDGFIASQKEMAKIVDKLVAAKVDKPDAKLQAELDAVAKKNGFKDFADYDIVAANISAVFAGIDPKTGDFTDPVDAIKKEMTEVKADKTIKENDRKAMLEELEDALKTTQPIKFQENIALVKTYRAKIDAALQ